MSRHSAQPSSCMQPDPVLSFLFPGVLETIYLDVCV